MFELNIKTVNSMKKGLIVVIILAIVLLGFGCGIKSAYNEIVTKEQSVQKAWSDVETNYQRRTDLYSSVVKTIEGSANFEKSTLKDVIDARSKATSINVDVNDSASLGNFQRAQSQLQGAFGRLMAVSEAYPDLKTTTAFQGFQAQIEGTENRINVARRDYNKAVNEYNTDIKKFPRNIIASFFNYKEKAYYKADAGSEKNPDIDFNIK
ncbi:MAG: LemA family protein [Chitinophagaceae bacterium]